MARILFGGPDRHDKHRVGAHKELIQELKKSHEVYNVDFLMFLFDVNRMIGEYDSIKEHIITNGEYDTIIYDGDFMKNSKPEKILQWLAATKKQVLIIDYENRYSNLETQKPSNVEIIPTDYSILEFLPKIV